MSHFWTEEIPMENWDENELPYGWVGEWTCPNKINFEHHFQLYRDVVEWLETNVINHRANTKWVKLGDCIYVQFRKKKDYMWFLMRFGHE